MTVHTRLSRGHIGVPRLLDVAVAIAAIHTQLARVQGVAEGHRLDRGVAHASILRCGVVGDTGGDDAGCEPEKYQDLKRQLVGRLGKKLGHDESVGTGGR